MRIKNIKMWRKVPYFAGVNERSLARGKTLFEGCPRVNAVVSGFSREKKKRENQLNISSRSLPFLKPACMCVHAAEYRRKLMSTTSPTRRPGYPKRFIERRDLAARQVTSRADEDPGIADSDGNVVWSRTTLVVISASFERREIVQMRV